MFKTLLHCRLQCHAVCVQEGSAQVGIVHFYNDISRRGTNHSRYFKSMLLCIEHIPCFDMGMTPCMYACTQASYGSMNFIAGSGIWFASPEREEPFYAARHDEKAGCIIQTNTSVLCIPSVIWDP